MTIGSELPYRRDRRKTGATRKTGSLLFDQELVHAGEDEADVDGPVPSATGKDRHG